MSDAIKNWLPITKRNRVALGFAFAALVMFVTWNLFPHYQHNFKSNPVTYRFDGLIFMRIWVDIFNPDIYLHVIRSPDMDGFLGVAMCMALLLNGLLVLAIVPFWKILHSSNYLRIPLAVANFAGGLVISWVMFMGGVDYNMPYTFVTLLLVTLTMLALSAALFIFKNEFVLRNDLEVKKTMDGE